MVKVVLDSSWITFEVPSNGLGVPGMISLLTSTEINHFAWQSDPVARPQQLPRQPPPNLRQPQPKVEEVEAEAIAMTFGNRVTAATTATIVTMTPCKPTVKRLAEFALMTLVKMSMI